MLCNSFICSLTKYLNIYLPIRAVIVLNKESGRYFLIRFSVVLYPTDVILQTYEGIRRSRHFSPWSYIKIIKFYLTRNPKLQLPNQFLYLVFIYSGDIVIPLQLQISIIYTFSCLTRTIHISFRIECHERLEPKTTRVYIRDWTSEKVKKSVTFLQRILKTQMKTWSWVVFNFRFMIHINMGGGTGWKDRQLFVWYVGR